MSYARILGSASLLLVVASGCAPDERPPPVVAIAAEPPSTPAPPRPRLQIARTFTALPASVRDERRFANRARALVVTELQGLESLYSATPPGSPDRPKLMLRLANEYGELEHVAEADRLRFPAGDPAEGKARVIARAARSYSVKYYALLVHDHPQWCLSPDVGLQRGCVDASVYYVALTLERDGQLDQARKAYLELIQSSPQSRYVPLAFLAFGELFLAEAQQDPAKLELAEQAYNEVTKYPPPANSAYGHAEYRLGQVLALRGDSLHALAHLRLAAAYAEGSGDAALAALTAAMTHDVEQSKGSPPAGM